MSSSTRKGTEQADRLLTPRETAEYLGVENRLLNDWRYREIGPPYLKLGHRTVRYSARDLDAWLRSRKVAS